MVSLSSGSINSAHIRWRRKFLQNIQFTSVSAAEQFYLFKLQDLYMEDILFSFFFKILTSNIAFCLIKFVIFDVYNKHIKTFIHSDYFVTSIKVGINLTIIMTMINQCVILMAVSVNNVHLNQLMHRQFLKLSVCKYPTSVNNSEIYILLPKPWP